MEPGADGEKGLHSVTMLDAQGAAGAGSRNATSCHRLIAQPSFRLNLAQSGNPRNVPVTRAVDGPPEICVHARPAGVGWNAARPSRCNRRHAAAA